jgi:undecaprenyl-diphosphatase
MALASSDTMRALLKIRPDFRLGVMIVVASVPTAIIGLGFQDRLELLFASPRAVGAALLMTAAVLVATARLKRGMVDELSMNFSHAILIGVAQGLAIAPGLSRSGLTIGLALILGLRRELAARFSFVLSIPAITGGLALSLGRGYSSSLGAPWLILGLVLAGVCGWAALRLLALVVDRGRLALFAPWCAIAGLAAIILSFRG